LRNAAGRLRGLGASDFVRHGLLVFVATTLVNAFGYGFHFAISRKIGVEQYGVLSALNAGLMISLVVSQIVTTVAVKYAAEFRAAGDRARLGVLVRRLTVGCTIAGMLSAAVGVASAGTIAAYFHIANVRAVDLTMIVIGIGLITPSLRGVLQGMEEFGTFSISICLESFVKMALGVGFVYAGYGVDGAFAGWAIGSFSSLLYTAWVLGRSQRYVRGVPLHVDLRRLGTTMAGVSIATVLMTSISYADVLVVKHFADPTTAGLYGALALSGKILFFLVGFVPTIVLPKATRIALGGASPVGVFLQALGVIAGLSGGGLLAFYLFPRFVITTLAGSAFAPAAPYVFAYGFAMVLLAVLNVIVAYKIGIHRFDFVWPLALCAVGEIVGISFYHRSLADVIAVLVAGNGIALLASAFRLNVPPTRAAAASVAA
jgi:O-antigen/teichoic acid export membrane protein